VPSSLSRTTTRTGSRSPRLAASGLSSSCSAAVTRALASMRRWDCSPVTDCMRRSLIACGGGTAPPSLIASELSPNLGSELGPNLGKSPSPMTSLMTSQ